MESNGTKSFPIFEPSVIECSHEPMATIECSGEKITLNRAARLLLRLLHMPTADLARDLMKDIREANLPQRKVIQLFSRTGHLAHKLLITKMNQFPEPKYLIELTRFRRWKLVPAAMNVIDDPHWM